MKKKKTLVRDGYLKDLPNKIQSDLMSISKLISERINELLKDKKFNHLNENQWARSALDEFCTTPGAKSQVGSVRSYKIGADKYDCMIQISGHIVNHRNDFSGELLHDFLKIVHKSLKNTIKKKYKMRLDSEGLDGDSFEGFDVYPIDKDVCKDIWDSFEEFTTKTIVESVLEDIDEMDISDNLFEYYEFYYGNMTYDQYIYEKSHGKLKYDFRRAYDVNTGHALKIVYSLDNIDIKDIGDNHLLYGQSKELSDKYNKSSTDEKNKIRKDQVNEIKKDITKKGNLDHSSKGQKVLAIVDRVTGKKFKPGEKVTVIGPYNALTNFNLGFPLKLNKNDLNEFINGYENDTSNFGDGIDFNNKLQTISVGEVDNTPTFKSTKFLKKNTFMDKDYSNPGGPKVLWDKAEKNTAIEELFKGRGSKIDDIDDDIENGIKYNHPSKKDKRDNPSAYKKESTDNVPEYNVDMSEKQAKNTLRTLSQGIMNDIENKKDYKVSQYTANIYANIITKNLLPIWAKGFKKFSITLDSYQSFFTFEFKVPKMTQDFVARFVDGRESINGLIHREPEIKVKMSPRIFHTMKDPNDAYNFFKAAIQYYDSKLEKASESLMFEIKKLGYGIKHLVSNTKLSGLVTYPMSLLFVFDDVQMYNKYIFRVSNDDINTINKFVRSIPSRYAAPEKEKAKIVEDIKELVKSLREKSSINESATDLFQFAEAVETYLNGGYDQLLQNAFDKFEYENTDTDWMRDPNNPQVKVLQEKFGVKKLKKIPVDLVAYISIETEAIRDANDKMMIASYCLGKIEIVEWYIELLEVGSKKYIVPHTKQYLESVRTQLLACYKKIMEVKISNTPLSDRPIVDIKYPKGYEG